MNSPSNSLINRSQRSFRYGVFFLYAALLIRGIGLAQKFLWSAFETETSIFGVLYFDVGLTESLALWLDDGLIWTYLIFAVLLLGMSRLDSSNLQLAALVFCVLWELLLVAAIAFRGDAFQPLLTPATHALRIATPVLLFVSGRFLIAGGATSQKWLMNGLRLAIALTFFGHGCSAWLQNPQYATFILATAGNLFACELSQSSVEALLRAIAILDFVVAAGVVTIRPLAKCHRWLLIYAAGWGLMTAASRMTTSGVFVWHETLLRASHFFGPLALICFCYQWLNSNVATCNDSKET